MAIYDLFLNNPRTRAARYGASQAEAGALRQTSGVLGNQAVNPAAAAQSLAQTSATQRAASHGMVAQAQAADEAARAEGVQQLVGTGLSALSSGMAMGMGGMGGGAGGGGPLGAVTDLVGGLVPPTTQGAAPAPSVAQGAMGPAPATFQGFGNAGAPFMGQPQMAPGVAAGAPSGSFSAENPYGKPAPDPAAAAAYAPQMPIAAGGVKPIPASTVLAPPQQGAPQAAMPAERQGPQGSPLGTPQTTLLDTPGPGYMPPPQAQSTGPRPGEMPVADPRQMNYQDSLRAVDDFLALEPTEAAMSQAPQPQPGPRQAQPAQAAPAAPAQSAAPGGDQTAVNMMQAFAPILLDYFARYGAR